MFRLDYPAVMSALRRYAREALAKGARAVILIGSLARGDYTAFSDADVVVIDDSASGSQHDRILKYMEPRFPVDLEPRVYTTAEVLRMARNRSRIVEEIVRYGKLLAGDELVLEEVRKAYLSSPR